jgi:hypothetical protein
VIRSCLPYTKKGNDKGVQACKEMLGYAQSMLDRVKNETAPPKDK